MVKIILKYRKGSGTDWVPRYPQEAGGTIRTDTISVGDSNTGKLCDIWRGNPLKDLTTKGTNGQ